MVIPHAHPSPQNISALRIEPTKSGFQPFYLPDLIAKTPGSSGFLKASVFISCCKKSKLTWEPCWLGRTQCPLLLAQPLVPNVASPFLVSRPLLQPAALQQSCHQILGSKYYLPSGTWSRGTHFPSTPIFSVWNFR